MNTRGLESTPADRSGAIDPLTGVFNRWYMADRLTMEVVSATRRRAPIAVLFADIDNLKQLNDRFGRVAGDRALRSVAAQIHRTLRGEDLLGRYGGNEFVVLARVNEATTAVHLAERMRAAIEWLHIVAGGDEIRVTVSVGIASLTELAPGDEHAFGLLELADARMNAAKALGGNRVCSRSSP